MKAIRSALRHALRCAAVGSGLVLFSVVSHAQEAQAREIALDIKPQSMSDALGDWARQTGLQLIFPDVDITNRLAAPPVRGTYTAQAALNQLLAGTELTYEFVNERTVSIRVRRPAAPMMGNPMGLKESSSTDRPESANRLAAAMASDVPVEREPPSGPTKSPVLERERSVTERNDNRLRSVNIDEVIVTGSHIRGITNPTAPISVYDRAAIDRSGYASTEQFVQALPQNFKGGANGLSADAVISGNRTNSGNGTAVNLRGLGNSSTLVLLDGHRVAPFAKGEAVNIAAFPLAAIEQIDVMTDGGSAIYGADAVGGVVNFVLRRDYQGAETQARLGTVTEGNRNQVVLAQTLGHVWQGGGAIAVLQYDDATALSAADRSATELVPRPTDIYPSTSKYSGFLKGHQSLGAGVEGFGSVLYNHERGVRDLTTVGIGTERITTSGDLMSMNAGISWQLGADWRLEFSGLYSESRSDLSEVYSSPTGNPPGYTNGAPQLVTSFSLTEGDFKADGSLLPVPGGYVKLAFGGSYRTEKASSSLPYVPLRIPFDRDVTSAFMELRVPLVGSTNRIRLVESFDVSIAARYDRYSDFGRTFNPMFGVFWAPDDHLNLRASYGRSFRAPTAAEGFSTSQGRYIFSYPGFAQPSGGTGTVLLVGSPLPLGPEKSRNFSVGGTYRPDSIRGLTLAATYYDILYENRIVSAPIDASSLIKPEIFGSLFTTLATNADAAAYLESFVANGYQYINFSGVGSQGVRFALPFGLINAARVRQTGFDVGAQYTFAIGQNNFNLALNSTVINEIETGFCGSCETTDLSNKYGEPLRFRLRGDVSWSRGAWQINGAINHANAYTNTRTVPESGIEACTTFDLNAQYSPASFSGLVVSVGVINVFDAAPPRVAATSNGVLYDTGNGDPLGRFASLQIRKSW